MLLCIPFESWDCHFRSWFEPVIIRRHISMFKVAHFVCISVLCYFLGRWYYLLGSGLSTSHSLSSVNYTLGIIPLWLCPAFEPLNCLWSEFDITRRKFYDTKVVHLGCAFMLYVTLHTVILQLLQLDGGISMVILAFN